MDQPRHRVLIIEDEALLLQSMRAALSTLAEVEVTGVQLIAAALTALEVELPDLLITDLSLPDGNGLQAIDRLERLGHNIPIIIQTGQLSQYREALPHNPRLVVLEKPVSMKELRNHVSVQLGGAQQGQQHDPFGIVDYLQLAAFSRRSLLLTVRSQDGLVGQVVIVDGDVWQARHGVLIGVDAIAAMVSGTQATIEVDELRNLPGERTVEVSTQGLLMELARIEDEARHYDRAPELPDFGTAESDDAFAELGPLADADAMLAAVDA
ncbi:MAG: response regulator, partial [Myxococcales bacterium]|nr:response regulator [Myxococcales bacterium]